MLENKATMLRAEMDQMFNELSNALHEGLPLFQSLRDAATGGTGDFSALIDKLPVSASTPQEVVQRVCAVLRGLGVTAGEVRALSDGASNAQANVSKLQEMLRTLEVAHHVSLFQSVAVSGLLSWLKFRAGVVHQLVVRCDFSLGFAMMMMVMMAMPPSRTTTTL